MAYQKGFTIGELLFALALIGVLALGGLVVWALVHFALKFW